MLQQTTFYVISIVILLTGLCNSHFRDKEIEPLLNHLFKTPSQICIFLIWICSWYIARAKGLSADWHRTCSSLTEPEIWLPRVEYLSLVCTKIPCVLDLLLTKSLYSKLQAVSITSHCLLLFFAVNSFRIYISWQKVMCMLF